MSDIKILSLNLKGINHVVNILSLLKKEMANFKKLIFQIWTIVNCKGARLASYNSKAWELVFYIAALLNT